MKRQTVCVFCGSGTQADAAYFEAAKRLGMLCAEQGIRIVDGAGHMGMMGAVMNSCLDHGGQVTGVIPQFMVDRGWHSERLVDLRVTPDMGTRKQLMRDLSDGLIAMPGGCGTLEELFESITQRQLGLYPKPIVLLNTAGFFDDTIAQLSHCIKEHFIQAQHATLWAVADTPEQALELFLTLPDGPEFSTKNFRP